MHRMALSASRIDTKRYVPEALFGALVRPHEVMKDALTVLAQPYTLCAVALQLLTRLKLAHSSWLNLTIKC